MLQFDGYDDLFTSPGGSQFYVFFAFESRAIETYATRFPCGMSFEVLERVSSASLGVQMVLKIWYRGQKVLRLREEWNARQELGMTRSILELSWIGKVLFLGAVVPLFCRVEGVTY